MSAVGDGKRLAQAPANDNVPQAGEAPNVADASSASKLLDQGPKVRRSRPCKPLKRSPSGADSGASKGLGVEVLIPEGLPIQVVEIEVLAELLDSLGPAANDNEGPE